MTMHTFSVYIDLQSPVSILRNKMYEKDDTLKKDNFILVYCGNIMEDHSPIYMYDVMNGATVHLFKKMKIDTREFPKCGEWDGPGLVKVGVALRSLSLNCSYKCALMKISKTKLINEIILHIPELREDPVGITLLQHPELLVKLNDIDAVKRLADNHKGLAMAAFQLTAVVHERALQNHLASDVLARSMSAGSDDEMEDLDDSSPGSDTNNQPLNRNLPYAITAAQLATAIANVTTQQPQPSTSGASTSTANTGNVLVTPNTTQSQPTTPAVDYTHQLGIMREMGLYNEPLNLQGLRLGGGSLETAIELVLSGFDILDTDDSNPLF